MRRAAVLARPRLGRGPRRRRRGRAADRRRARRAVRRQPVLVSADELQYDQDLGLTIAKGHVELDQSDQILLADTVTYNQRTDTVTASGHVSLLQPTGDIVFADYIELHDDMRDGFIKDIRLLLSDRSRLAGNTARRVAGTRTEIRRARLFAVRAVRRRSDAAAGVADQGRGGRRRQGAADRRISRRGDGDRRHPGPLFALFLASRSVGEARERVPAADLRLRQHARLPHGDPLLLGDRAPTRTRPSARSSRPAPAWCSTANTASASATARCTNDASIEAGGGRQTTSRADIGPPTGPVRGHIFGTGDMGPHATTGAPAITCSASPTRPICCAIQLPLTPVRII